MRKNLHHLLIWLIMVIFPISLFAQNRTVTGTVTAANNTPIPGATVTIKSTTQATTTDANGKFSINVPDNAVLIVSIIGYKTQNVNTTGNTNLNIKLEEDVSRLDEVVVTGLATSVKRKNLANAVEAIGAKELNGVAPAQTFDAALEGKITGANIKANSGARGGGVSGKLRGGAAV